MEIFLTAVCWVWTIVVIAYFHYLVVPLIVQILKDQETQKDVIYHTLLKIATIRDVEDLLTKARRDIITQMGDLATKQDFSRVMDNLDQLTELKAKLKEDRFKSMREAFGGKKEED